MKMTNSLSMCLKCSKQIYYHVNICKENYQCKAYFSCYPRGKKCIFFFSFFGYHIWKTGIKLLTLTSNVVSGRHDQWSKISCSTCRIRSLYCFFFSFLPISYDLRSSWLTFRFTVGLKILTSKNHVHKHQL